MKYFTWNGRQVVTDVLWTQDGSLLASDIEVVDGLYREITADDEWRLEAARFYGFDRTVVETAIEVALRCTSSGPFVIDADAVEKLMPRNLPRVDEAIAYLVEGGMFRR